MIGFINWAIDAIRYYLIVMRFFVVVVVVIVLPFSLALSLKP